MSSFIDKKILVTGGAGYLATNIISLLRNENCHIIRFDRPDTVFPPIKGKCHLSDIKGDIRDKGIWNDLLEKTDIIFHLAAQTSIYLAEKNPIFDLEINVLPMLNLLESCRANTLGPEIIFSGTVTQTGLTEKYPVNESQPDDPITVYDLHKLMAERYLEYYSKKGFVKGCTLRLSNVYGPGPQSSSADRGILNRMIRKAIEGESITVYGTGNSIRDYIYVEDVAESFIKAADSIENVNAKYFVIGSGVGHSLYDAFSLVIERVALKTGQYVDLLCIDPPHALDPIEMRDFIADTTSFRNATNWEAKHSLVAGIDHTIDSIIGCNDATEVRR